MKTRAERFAARVEYAHACYCEALANALAARDASIARAASQFAAESDETRQREGARATLRAPRAGMRLAIG
jgi:hypothetical protein